MLSYQERKNMVEFIVKMYGFEHNRFIYMTDPDLESWYDKAYYEIELQRDI